MKRRSSYAEPKCKRWRSVHLRTERHDEPAWEEVGALHDQLNRKSRLHPVQRSVLRAEGCISLDPVWNPSPAGVCWPRRKTVIRRDSTQSRVQSYFEWQGIATGDHPAPGLGGQARLVPRKVGVMQASGLRESDHERGSLQELTQILRIPRGNEHKSRGD